VSYQSNLNALKIAHSPIYKYELPQGHRFPMIKYELIPEQLIREGTINESDFFHPQALTDQEVLSVHTASYLEALTTLSLDRKEERAIGFPLREDLIIRGRHIAKGTYDCAKYAIQEGVAFNTAGGTHHAFADKGEGFCVFNDIAIASQLLLDRKEARQILVIDLDVHQGNGSAHIFQGEQRVFTLSVHGAKNYPLRKQESDLDIDLPDHTNTAHYLSTIRDTLPKLIDQVQPDLVFYLAGVDILETDKLGRLSVSRDGCKERDRYVLSQCKKNQIPVSIVMGGGYSHHIRDIIEAHANTFRVAQEMYF